MHPLLSFAEGPAVLRGDAEPDLRATFQPGTGNEAGILPTVEANDAVLQWECSTEYRHRSVRTVGRSEGRHEAFLPSESAARSVQARRACESDSWTTVQAGEGTRVAGGQVQAASGGSGVMAVSDQCS